MPRHGARGRRGNLGNQAKSGPMNSTLKSLLFWLLIVVILAAIWQFSSMQRAETAISFSEMLAKIQGSQVNEIEMTGKEAVASVRNADGTTNGPKFRTTIPE